MSGQLRAPAALPPGERVPGTHLIASWVAPQDRSGGRGEERNLNPTVLTPLPLSKMHIFPYRLSKAYMRAPHSLSRLAYVRKIPCVERDLGDGDFGYRHMLQIEYGNIVSIIFAIFV
jgi:hypothetical protein